MEKVTVKKITGIKEGGEPPKTWKITKFVDQNDRKLDTFDQVEEGKEYEGEVESNSNPAYSAKFKVNKPKRFGGAKRDYTIEARMSALNSAARLYASGALKSSQDFVTTRDKFFDYIMGK